MRGWISWMPERGEDPMMLSLHKFISCHPPGTLELFSCIRGRAFLMSFQMCEQYLMGIFEIRRCWRDELKYFSSKTCFHQEGFHVMNLQIIFSLRAMFINSRSWIEIPPFSYGIVTCFQFIRTVFFYFDLPHCHRNFLIMSSINFFIPFGA